MTANPTKTANADEGGTYVLRFRLYHRFLHALIVISFLGLVLTGMPLKYNNTGWARTLATCLGGVQAAGAIHRACGAITFLYFFLHLVFVLYYLVRLRKEPLFKFFFGPDSMVPGKKDIRDLVDHIRWFLGSGEHPQFGRFTYWEKFDYFAVFWGVGIIGLSGLLLWFPVFFARFLPGWIYNVAIILHSEEALLAAGFIFTIHFFNTHLRPGKFPLDPVIFIGKISIEELRRERPLEYRRLLQNQKLDSLRTAPPSRTTLFWSRIAGFTAYGLGLIMIVLIVSSSLREILRSL